MNRSAFVVIVFIILSCSSQDSLRTDSAVVPAVNDVGGAGSVPVVSHGLSATSIDQDTLPLPATVVPPPDTLLTVYSDTTAVIADSTQSQLLYISEKLESARQYYLAALAAEETNDSSLCAENFESAIYVLDELSYLPDIESNKEFTDLSRNVVEDYEKYIASIDDIGPGASIFALREKLNQTIEEIDVKTVDIPKEEILGTTVDLPMNEHVERNISFFMGERGRQHFEKWMYLAGRFFPMMKRIFREEDIPEELIYLSMIESGLRPNARSWVKAVGLWQFMKGTGQLYGLRSNWWYDERRDFEKSTRAAARHMRDLYSEFGNWHVVLAAYNSGAGNVYRAIRRSGSTDYWGMRKYLPRQTRNYVPEYIAVVRMARAPEQYGFHGISPADSLAFDVVTINDCVDLRVLAECASADIETLRELNPELLQWCTPPGVTGYQLRIPRGTSDLFAVHYAKIPDEQKRDWAIHTVKKGETLSEIARRYGLTAALLMDANKIKSSRTLSIGAKLSIPLPKELLASRGKVPFENGGDVRGMDFTKMKAYIANRDASRNRSTATKVKSPTGKVRLVYRVKRGDTIGHIAEWYRVRASDLRNWNDIPYGSYLRVNQQIVVWVVNTDAAVMKSIDSMSFTEKQSLKQQEPREASILGALSSASRSSKPTGWVQYKVRNGDSLDKIARQHGVRIVDIKTWNNLRSSKIVTGQVLSLYGNPDERTTIVRTSPSETRKTDVTKSSASRVDLASSDQLVHHVKKGETLWELAKKYGVTVKELGDLNKIDDGLKAGDRIVIPRP